MGGFSLAALFEVLRGWLFNVKAGSLLDAGLGVLDRVSKGVDLLRGIKGGVASLTGSASIIAANSGGLAACSMVGAIICFIYNTIAHPNEATNQFMIWFLDSWLLDIIPSSPESMRIANLITQIGSDFPLLGSALLLEILVGIQGILVIFVSMRLLKYLPFI